MIDLDKRLADMPVMVQRKSTLPAPLFNQWRLLKPTLGNRIDITLPGLKTMHFVMTPNFWVVVDAANYDAPIIAWLDFNIANRENLHQPIQCTLNYYHFAASALRAKSLEIVSDYLSRHNLEQKTTGTIHQLH